MTDLFRSLNQSEHLNAQNCRQAHYSELSEYVRELGDHLSEFFLLLCCEPKKLDKRVHEEEIAKLICKIKSNYSGNTNKTDLDKLYFENNTVPKELRESVDEFRDVLKIFVDDPKFQSKSRQNKNLIAALMDFVYLITHDKTVKIENGWEFYAWFLEKAELFRQQAKKVLEENQEEESFILVEII